MSSVKASAYDIGAETGIETIPARIVACGDSAFEKLSANHDQIHPARRIVANANVMSQVCNGLLSVLDVAACEIGRLQGQLRSDEAILTDVTRIVDNQECIQHDELKARSRRMES